MKNIGGRVIGVPDKSGAVTNRVKRGKGKERRLEILERFAFTKKKLGRGRKSI